MWFCDMKYDIEVMYVIDKTLLLIEIKSNANLNKIHDSYRYSNDENK